MVRYVYEDAGLEFIVEREIMKTVLWASAIVKAVLLQHTAIFRLLGKYGESKSSSDVGALALKLAYEQGMKSMVGLLLKADVPVHVGYCGLAPHVRRCPARSIDRFFT
jgi:hypothetical protein